MQRVHALMRLTPPFTSARTVWMFGSNRRGRTLWACETRRPTTGPLPQISHRIAIARILFSVMNLPRRANFDYTTRLVAEVAR
jgi:hypothetical protein